MSEVEKRTKTLTEFAIPNPTNWKQLQNALDAALRFHVDSGRTVSDDSFWVRADEDEIVIWCEDR